MLTRWFALPVLLAAALSAQDRHPQRLLFVGEPDTPRGKAFTGFLGAKFASVRAAKRFDDLGDLMEVDVVVLDWPQQGADSISEWMKDAAKKAARRAPLGQRDEWTTPTVLLGSAGLNLACVWDVRGSYGWTCLDPFAYGLREHPVIAGPEPFDRTRTVSKAAPQAWASAGVTGNVDVVPLVEGDRKGGAGWCTYKNTLDDGPDVEWILGGVNSKHPEAAGIWRQGNLLHFGFEPAPDALNANGKALLVNSICYVAKFREDRPLLRTPSPFVAKDMPRSRTLLQSAINAKKVHPELILGYFDKSLHAELAQLDATELAVLCRARMDYLRAGPHGALILDEDARVLPAPHPTLEGLEKCIKAAQVEATRPTAVHLLARLCPDTKRGPDEVPASALAEWWAANKEYVFFCESAGQTWHVDPLAQKRGVPTAELRGPERASAGADEHRR